MRHRGVAALAKVVVIALAALVPASDYRVRVKIRARIRPSARLSTGTRAK